MTTATGILPDQKLEKQIEKQMGCMTGFLQIFDRHQILTGKRLYATKRLTPSPAGDSTPLSEKSVGSPMDSRELHPQCTKSSLEIRSPAVPEIVTPKKEIPVRMASSPLQVFDVKESLQRTPWKFREAPRLSLDSRATVDGKGSLYPKEIRTNAAIFSATTRCQSSTSSFDVEAAAATGAAGSGDNDTQRRSPSVIAKLMGLEALPETTGREPIKKVELRRSASESRVSRDLRFDETLLNSRSNCVRDNVAAEDHRSKARLIDSMEFGTRNLKSEPPQRSSCFVSTSQWNSHQQRKSFYDSQDFFPEPKQNGTLYGEIEKRLKMRGIDEPEKDLETLKQILEALQLKGLLHSKKPAERITNRNFVFDRRFSSDESPIVIMKPARSQGSLNNRIGRGGGSESSPESNFRSKGGINRNTTGAGARLNRPEIEQQRNQQKERRPGNSRSPDRNENNAKSSPSSLARRRQLNIDTQRRGNDSRSPIHSPKVISPRKTGSDHNNKSPRNRKPMFSTDVISSPRERIYNQGVDDDSSAISESSFSASSQIDTELQRTKMEDYKEGRSLLERCDKLLHSIAEITSSETELQPSPVSVLDSSFYKDESSPSPVLRRRCIDFKDHHHRQQSMELDDEMWSPMISPMRLKLEEISSSSEDSDFIYVSEILRVSECISEDDTNTDVFLLLERRSHQYKSTSSTSTTNYKVSKVHRRLVFDTITEILDRKTQLPPWKMMLSSTTTTSLGSGGGSNDQLFKQVWSEFEKIRERESTEDLFEVICGALKKDMAGDGINGWVDCPVETSEAVLDIERLIFKDLVAETIRDLADFSGSGGIVSPAPRRRTLVF